jgi:hypothetical protein
MMVKMVEMMIVVVVEYFHFVYMLVKDVLLFVD